MLFICLKTATVATEVYYSVCGIRPFLAGDSTTVGINRSQVRNIDKYLCKSYKR